MNEWKKTSCILCFNNCGLEVITEGSKILKVRSDKENPRSQGYLCRKGANIAYFQNNPERLKFPLKRAGDCWERVSWDRALDEIAGRLKEIVKTYGPRSSPTWEAVVRVAILKQLSAYVFCMGWDRKIITVPWPRN